MKTKVLHDLKSSLLLFLWLLLVQTICALFTLAAAILALVLMALGGSLVLGGSTSLREWIAAGVPVCLFWLMMGWFAPRDVRPGPAGAAVVLAMWAVLTSLMPNMYLLLLAQRACGGMLGQILWRCGYIVWLDKAWDLAVGCFLLPAALGMGLLLGRKRAGAASQGG